MTTVKLLSDAEVDAIPAVKAVFDDIRATRKSDFVNNFWRGLFVRAGSPASGPRPSRSATGMGTSGSRESVLANRWLSLSSRPSDSSYARRDPG